MDVLYAEKITRNLLGDNQWVPPDDIPIRYPFDYEKDIIAEYTNGQGRLLSLAKIERGCPEQWPQVEKIGSGMPTSTNPIPLEIRGGYREENDTIIVDARSRYHCLSGGKEKCCLENIGLSFPEAGPRKNLVYPMESRDGHTARRRQQPRLQVCRRPRSRAGKRGEGGDRKIHRRRPAGAGADPGCAQARRDQNHFAGASK